MSAIFSNDHWQLTALGLLIAWTLTATAAWSLAAALAFFLRRHSAQARLRVWAISMIVVLLAPLVVLLAAPLLPAHRWWRLPDATVATEALATTSPVQLPTKVDPVAAPQAVPNTAPIRAPRLRDENRARVLVVTPSSPTRAAAAVSNVATASPRSQPDHPAFHWIFWLLVVWLIGVAARALLFAWAMWRVHHLRAGAVELTASGESRMLTEICHQLAIRRTVRLLVSPRADVPLLCGLFIPAVILPVGHGRWPASRLRMVLVHELIHLKRRDVAWEIVAQLATLPVWFHPLAWLAVRRMRVERELACDDAVLMSGATAEDYAEQLVEVAAEMSATPPLAVAAVAMAGASPIERRVRSILDPRTWRAPLGRWRTIGLAACMASLVAVVAVLTPASGDEKAKDSPPAAKAKPPASAGSAAPYADQRIIAALNHPTTINLQNVSLDDALLALSESCGVPIALDANSFEVSGIEMSPTVTVQTNGEPLGGVLRSLARSSIGGAKIGISVVAKDGAVRICAKGAIVESGDDKPDRGQTVYAVGAVLTADGKPAANASIVARLRWEIVYLHADEKGRFSIPRQTDDRGRFPMIVRSADGSEMAVQEFPGWWQFAKVTLGPTKTVSLVVTDGKGRPIAQAHAAIIEMPEYEGFQETLVCGYTDDSGKFTERLPKKFQVGFAYAYKSGAGLDYRSFVPPGENNSDLHVKTPPQPVEPVQVTLAGARRVTIKCVDESGKPIPGLEVTPWILEKPGETGYLNDGRSWHVFTDANGEAVFGWIPIWPKRMFPFSVSPASGRRMNDVDIKFDPEKPTDQFTATIHRNVELSGTVRDVAGKPVAGAEIDLHGVGYSNQRHEDHTKSDDHGRYEFEVPPLHIYGLAANTKDRRQASPMRNGIAVYTQKPVTGVDLTLVPTTRVFGRVTLGPDNEPAVKYRVNASDFGRGRMRAPDPDFPHGRRDYIGWPNLSEFAFTDAQGRFELRLAPGKYDFFAGPTIRNGGMIIYPDQELHHKVEINGEKQLELNLNRDAPPKIGVLHGVVVNGGKPVPGAIIDGASQPGPNFDAVANGNGAFDIRVPTVPAVIFAKSKDGSLGGVARVGPTQRNISVHLGPTATVTMRLLHKDKTPFSSDRAVRYFVEIPMDPSEDRGGFHSGAESVVHPDRNGKLVMQGMVVGETYVISLQDIDSRSDYSRLTTIQSQKPGENMLPDITYEDRQPYKPPTLDERVADEFSGGSTAIRRNRNAMGYARVADARVLVTFADPKSPLTKKLVGLYFDDDLRSSVFGEYCTVAISTAGDKLPQAEALAKQLGITLPKDSPLVVAEDADGKVLSVLEPSALFDKKGAASPDVLRAFFARNAVPRQDGRAIFDAALAEAKRENKRVLADQMGVGCGPCITLASFLEKNRRLWEKDYIWIKMDLRWPHATEIMKSLKTKRELGIPWVAILDSNGKVIGRYLGFPDGDDAADIDRFVEMFKSTAQRMTPADLAQFKKALEAAAK